jgi:Immunity protein 8
MNLEEFSPAHPNCFSFLLQAMLGPEGSEGEESIDILVCTPGWLASEVERVGLVDGRHHLVVSQFDLAQIRSFLVAYAKSYASKTWPEAATKLSRLGKWELEDYRP